MVKGGRERLKQGEEKEEEGEENMGGIGRRKKYDGRGRRK